MNKKQGNNQSKGMIKVTTTATLRKWGNSMGVRLPAHFIKLLNIEEGTEMEIILTENQITLRPIIEKVERNKDIRQRYIELLAKADRETERHEEKSFGTVGREHV